MMTPEEAIKNLMPIKDLVIMKGWHNDFIKALDMATNALQTIEDLSQVEKDAYDAGYNAGYSDGRADEYEDQQWDEELGEA